MSASFPIPDYVKAVLSILNKNGFEAYLVGGCVRDFLLSNMPYDFDITTNALPEQVKSCFTGFPVIETGIAHGTVTVRIEKHNIEVTTYRIDGSYGDNRHPDRITFTPSLEEDLKRRDFTINALAYSEQTGIIDLFHGQEHLKSHLICCVGQSKKRFEEDALRILRALRFASMLGFSIEENTAKAIHETKELLIQISRERIYTELCKTLPGKNSSLIFCDYYDVLCTVIPEFLTVDKQKLMKGFAAVTLCPQDKFARFGAFFYGISGSNEVVRKVFRQLKADNVTISEVSALLEAVDRDIPAEKTALTRLCVKYGFNGAKNLILLKKALLLTEAELQDNHLSALDKTLEVVENLEKENACISLDTLAINGQDIIHAGIKDGKQIGILLKTIFEKVIDGKLKNERDTLLSELERTSKV